MPNFLFGCGWLALLAYALTVYLGFKAEPPVFLGNPLWLMASVTALGLSGILEVAEQVRDRLDGWKVRNARVEAKGPSVLELLEQIRDRDRS